MNENIYLTGFMGSGKTTVGRKLAELLNRKFVDMDAVIEKEAGRPISEIFESLGEDHFRGLESTLLKKTSRQARIVAATGGGIVKSPENRKVMRATGRIVHLKADFQTCLDRIGQAQAAVRPLWKDLKAARRLYDGRQELYADCDLQVAVDGLDPTQAAQAVRSVLFPDERFLMEMEGTACSVSAVWDAPAQVTEIVQDRRVMLLSDRNVNRLQGHRYLETLKPALTVTVSPGERSKTLKVARQIFQELLDNHFDRGDVLLAVGGGMVTDLGAFVAATYKRGMGFVLASTSLLGCVDAAVGGKSGVNLGQAKNAVGCFTIPKAVFLDAHALKTLPTVQIREGLVEAYKTGLVASADLAGLVESELKSLLARDLPGLAKVAAGSARAKADVVRQDFRESGWRGILNLGHTYGHAIEGWHKYKVSHGQSVAMGTVVAIRLSLTRGLLSQEHADRIENCLRRIMPRRAAWPDFDQAWEIMKHDKKIRQGRMVFVLLEGPGRPVLVNDVTQSELAEALEGLEDA